MKWRSYKRRSKFLFKQCTIKNFIYSQRNNVYNYSKVGRLSGRYWEFHLHLSEEVRWLWLNSKLKFYRRKSIRESNCYRDSRGFRTLTYQDIKNRRENLVVYSED